MAAIMLVVPPRLIAQTATQTSAQPSYSAAQVAQIMAEAPQMADIQLSPDGRWVTYSASRGSVRDNGYDTRLYLRATSGQGEPLPLARQSAPSVSQQEIFTVRWCPSSQCFLYFARTSTTPAQSVQSRALVRYDLATRRETPVTIRDTAGPSVKRPRVTAVSADYSWSPSGKYVAFTAPITSGNGLDARRGVAVSTSWAGSAPPRVGLFVLDVASGIVTQLTPDSLHVQTDPHAYDWAPDERVLVVTVAPDPEGVPAMRTDLVIVDRVSRAVRPLVTRPGRDARPLWSPDGHSIAFFTFDGERLYSGGNWPAVVSVADGAVTAFPHDAPTRFFLGPAWWTPDGRRFVYVASYQMSAIPILADPATRRTAVLSSPAGHLPSDDNFSVSADRRLLAYTRESLAAPPELFVTQLDASGNAIGVARQLTHESSGFPLTALVNIDSLSWPSTDGKFTVHGLLLTPKAAWRSGRIAAPLPTVVYLIGGPSMVRRQFNGEGMNGVHVALATRGYAVLIPNTRGRGGYGEAFQRGIRDGRSAGRLPFEDVMAGVELLAGRGIADTTRLGVEGHSYGGYLTSYIITQTSRFKAAINNDGAFPHWFQAAILATPGTDLQLLARDLHGVESMHEPADRERIVAESPALNMNRVTTPTLLLFGAQANAASVGRLLYAQLSTFHVPSQLVVYDEGHVFARPAAVADMITRASEWMDRYVRGMK